jgi:hypothetical protein
MPAVQIATASATQILAANAAVEPRTRLLITNLGPNTIYLGPDNTVTTATGLPVPTGASVELRGTINGTVFGIAATALQVTPADTRYWVEQAGV